MSKPLSMSVKEWLIKKMAVNMVVSEKIINEVVTHQFDSANDALNLHKSVELSGFGKFYFNQGRAVKKLEKWELIKTAYENMLQEPGLSDTKRKNTEVRLEKLLVSIKLLNKRVNEN